MLDALDVLTASARAWLDGDHGLDADREAASPPTAFDSPRPVTPRSIRLLPLRDFGRAIAGRDEEEGEGHPERVGVLPLARAYTTTSYFSNFTAVSTCQHYD
jgi:hypothetical protein